MSCKVLTIVGPTASGKSDLAVKLAEKFNGEIINGDSIQVYKGLDIGSAKISEEEMHGIPHHLLSVREIEEGYSVKDFQDEARKLISDITERGKLPIVCGGTGLYIKALLYDYSFVKENNSKEEYEDEDTASLYQKLQELDPVSAEKIHPNNRKRVVRALQLAETGTTKSEQESAQNHEPVYDAFICGLTMDRNVLKERIDLRVDKMFSNGLIEEVTDLNSKYDWSLQALQGIGYKEFKDYFNGTKSLEEVKTDIKTHTRQFAKRQYTWWNHQLPVRWYDVMKEGTDQQIIEDVSEWLAE